MYVRDTVDLAIDGIHISISAKYLNLSFSECTRVPYLAQFEFRFLPRVRVETSVFLLTDSGLNVYLLMQFLEGNSDHCLQVNLHWLFVERD